MTSVPGKRRAALLSSVALLLVGAAGGLLLVRDNEQEYAADGRPSDTCSAPPEILRRVERGYFRARSGDVLAVERLPNQFTTRHSSAHGYTQNVPLVLYGPGFIKQGIEPGRAVTLADIAPTMAELLDFDEFNTQPGRAGDVLTEALLPEAQRNGVPKLIVTLVWDGGGDNVLEQWPGAWSNFRRLMRAGAHYKQATVGSTPSITPAIHATIGTGAFPRSHGITDTRIRVAGGIKDSWTNVSPRYLELTTIADEFDKARGNAPKVGLMARDAWHLGMMGHGASLNGADKDIAILDDLESVSFTSNETLYTLPEYAESLNGLDDAIAEVDQRDGEADVMWLGHTLNPVDGRIRETPAWSVFQTQKLEELLTKEGFGQDEVPDLLFTNYKSTDLVGHSYNMVEPEEREALEEQDRQLAELTDFLDGFVGADEYVLIVTADHGMTPYPSVTGGWSIVMREMEADIENALNAARPFRPLIVANRGYQLFLNPEQLARNEVSAADVAALLRDYRLSDNFDEQDLPPRYAERADERLFLTALTPDEMKACRGR